MEVGTKVQQFYMDTLNFMWNLRVWAPPRNVTYMRPYCASTVLVPVAIYQNPELSLLFNYHYYGVAWFSKVSYLFTLTISPVLY